jgi:predicted membrane protein
MKICVGIMLLNDNVECQFNTQMGRISLLEDIIFIMGLYFSSFKKPILALNAALLFSIWVASFIGMTLEYDPHCLLLDSFSVRYGFLGIFLSPIYAIVLIDMYKKLDQNDLRAELAQEDIL